MEKNKKLWLIVSVILFVIILVGLGFSQLYSKQIESAFGLTSPNVNTFNDIEKGDLKVHFIDVGQGNCTFIELPDGKNMLIDAGPSSGEDNVVKFIQDLNVTKIDYLLLTHSDEDHVGGMDVVLETFEIDCIFRPFIFANNLAYLEHGDPLIALSTEHPEVETVTTKCYSEFIDLAYKETCDDEKTHIIVSYDGCVLTDTANSYAIEWHSPLIEEGYEESPISVLSSNGVLTTGYPTKAYEDVNGYSPVVTIMYQNRTCVFNGDATAETEADVINNMTTEQKDVYKNSSIFAIAHHGSKFSSTIEFLELFSPKYVIIQVASKNKYNHPDSETLKRVEDVWSKNGISGKLFQTSDNGNISFCIIKTNNDPQILVYADKNGVESSVKWWQISVGIAILSAILLFSPMLKLRKYRI